MAVFTKLLTELQHRHDNGEFCHPLTLMRVSLSDNGDEVDSLSICCESDAQSDDTIYYTAPEASGKHCDAQCDIFSATAILYTLLTGQAPWANSGKAIDSPIQRQIILKWQRRANKPDMTTIAEALQPIILRGLECDPAKRYTTAKEMRRDLESVHLDESEITGKTKSVDEEPQKVKRIFNDSTADKESFVFSKNTGNGFEDIAGMEELKKVLLDDVLFVLRNHELAQRYRLNTPNGILLYGPPGCGKTYIAEKFAEEAGTNFILVNASDLGSPYVHGTQEKIAQLFKQAKANAPVVICLDEFDAMAPDRSSHAGEFAANEVNEFLSQLNNCSKNGIFVIALTNRPDKLDPAILRSGRFDKKIYVPLPDKKARQEIFSIHLQGRPFEPEKLDWEKLSTLSDGYVGSDIALIVSDAARKAAHNNQLITEELLEDSLRANPPSVKSDTLKYYSTIRLQMEQGKDARPMIGFR